MSTTGVQGMLLLYHRAPRQDAATVQENIDAYGRYSRFPVFALNTDCGFPPALESLSFDVIVLHYSLFSWSGYHLNSRFLEYLDRARDAYKVALFQDEYHYCRQRFDFLNRYAIDCVYTQFEDPYGKQVYGAHTSVLDVVSHIPGYVSEESVEVAERLYVPDEQRHVDIGYRGRELQFYAGRGAREKFEVGRRFEEAAHGCGLVLDLASREQDRIYGDGWYRFVGGCRALLGTESGVSVVDIDDSIRLEYEQLMRENPDMTFDEYVARSRVDQVDGVIPYRTISPRHFEAAAFRTVQILLEGDYSGIMQPGVHYLALKKDYSNAAAVIEEFRDPARRTELSEAGRRDLIDSGLWSYERFIAGFDEHLSSRGVEPETDRERVASAASALARGRTRRALKRRARYASYRQFPGRAQVVRVVKAILRRAS